VGIRRRLHAEGSCRIGLAAATVVGTAAAATGASISTSRRSSDPIHHGTIYAGVYSARRPRCLQSTDGAQLGSAQCGHECHYRRAGRGGRSVDSGTVYAGSTYAASESTDGGATWNP